MKLENIINSKNGKGVAVIYKQGCYHIVTIDHEKLAGPVTVWISEYSYRESDFSTFDKIILSSGIQLSEKFKKTRIFL